LIAIAVMGLGGCGTNTPAKDEADGPRSDKRERTDAGKQRDAADSVTEDVNSVDGSPDAEGSRDTGSSRGDNDSDLGLESNDAEDVIPAADSGPVSASGVDAGQTIEDETPRGGSLDAAVQSTLGAGDPEAGISEREPGGSMATEEDNAASATGPALTDLAVDGARVPLHPMFDAEVVRYSVIAKNPASDLNVTATADSEFDIQIDGVAVQSGEPMTFPQREAGRDIVVDVSSSDGSTRSYTLVILPSTFPELTVTVNEPGVSPDPLYVTFHGRAYFVAQLDNSGVPLFWRSTPRYSYDFKKHPTGAYSYSVETGELNQYGRVQQVQVVLDEDFEEVEQVSTVGLNHTDRHEFHILPNGNRIITAYNGSVRDMTAYGGSAEELVQDSVVQELSPNNELLFEWSSRGAIPWNESLRPERGEYAHVNSVWVDTDGNWLISARAAAQVLKVDRESGEVIWKLGGISNQFTFIDDPFSHLCGQHTVSRLDNGNILIFDNGQICYPENPARVELTRVVEYEIDEDARTVKLVWSYDEPGYYTVSMGSAQRLPNGNTLIGWGRGPTALATEVDADGNKVFEIEARDAGGTVISYRVLRFAD
jgi:outer membrane protein assembly factor BamB